MKIGKRVRVTDLRKVWSRENDFSDWLITDEGLALLEEDLGISVEDPRRECRPGDFPCDIVGRAVGDERHVIIIENQFGKSDHDHLGKLLTYLTANSAATAVWICEHVSDDHRRVIDWLNDNTPSTAEFYLAQLKVYQIGDSPAAPQLDVVCRPNADTKNSNGSTDLELKERHMWRKSMWEEILPYLEQQKPPFRLQRPGTDAWSNIAIGRSDFYLALTLTPKRNCIGCELGITTSWKQEAFEQLKSEQAEIEAAIGKPVQWLELEGKKTARILLEQNVDPKLPENISFIKDWFAQYATIFYKTFNPRIKKLTPNSYDEEN